MTHASSRQRIAQTGGSSSKTFAPANYFAVFDTFIPSAGFITQEQNIHGGLQALGATGAALNSGSPIVRTAGLGKLLLVLNAGGDFSGTITVTGTSVDRDTGVETASDFDDIVVDALSTDGADADANGNGRHSLTGAYITSKWFKGSVTISTTDTTFTDVDTYQCSFEQVNDTNAFIVDTFDINFRASHATAELDAYLYSVMVTGSKVNVTRIASLNSGATTDGEYHRLRSGNIGATLAGATDGLFVDAFPSGNNQLESVTLKVWVAIIASGADVLTLRLRGADTPSSVTDNAVPRWNGTDGETLQNSKTTISDAGAMAIDDGSGNAIVLTPTEFLSTIAMNGSSIFQLVPTANLVTLSAPAGSGSTINIFPRYNDGVATVNLANGNTGQPTTVNVGSDAAGGTGTVNVDIVAARRASQPLTIKGNSGGGVNTPGGDKLTLGDSATKPPLNMTERDEPSAPASGDMYLDDGTNTASGGPGWRRYTGAVWEDVGATAGGGLSAGDSIATLIRIAPPGATAAHMRSYAGGSTPAERWPVWSFSGTSAEYLDFDFVLGSNYGGAGITVRIKWSADTANTDVVTLQAAIRRIADDAEQTSASHTYVYNVTSDTVANVLKEVKYSEIDFTNGADMDSWAAGELGRVRLLRDPAHGSDNMSGDMFVHSVTVVTQ